MKKFATIFASCLIALAPISVGAYTPPKVGEVVEFHGFACTTSVKAMEVAYSVEKVGADLSTAIMASNKKKKVCGHVKGKTVKLESRTVYMDMDKKPVHVTTLSVPDVEGKGYFAEYPTR